MMTKAAIEEKIDQLDADLMENAARLEELNAKRKRIIVERGALLRALLRILEGKDPAA